MTRAALVLVVLVAGLGALPVRGEDGVIVADLAWASSRVEAYTEQRIDWGGPEDENVRLPFGPDTSLLLGRNDVTGGYEVLLDRDFDGSLEDEKAIDFAAVPIEIHGFELPEDFTIDRQATELVRPSWAAAAGLRNGIRVHLRLARAPQGNQELYVAVLLHRRGHVALEGRERLVALYDGNGDLRFDHPTEDFLFLDLDGDRVIPRVPPSPERITAGEAFRVKSAGYVATLGDEYASRLEIRRVSAVPPASTTWTPEEVPPAAVEMEGEARPLEELRAVYAETKAAYKRSRTPQAFMRDLVLEVGRCGRSEAFPFLLEVYQEETSPALRASAVEAMGDVRYQEFAGRVVRIAEKDKDRRTCVEAIRSLHRMDAADRRKHLVRIARSTKDEKVYEVAAHHLGYLRTEEAYDALVALLKQNAKKPDRAYHAYYGATRFRPDPPAERLVALAVRAKAPKLQALALEDARQLPHPIARDLALKCMGAARETPVVRGAVIENLGRDGDGPTTKALLELAASFTSTDGIRAVQLLQATRDPAAIDAVRSGMSAREPKVRALAAGVAAHLPDPELGAMAARHIRKEDDPRARLAFVEAAGAHRAADAIASLLALLKSERTGEDLHQAAFDALVAIGFEHAEVTDYLLGVAKKAKWAVRLRLMDAAVEGGAAGAAPLFLLGLTDESWQIRLGAVQGLATIRVKASIKPLIDRLAVESKDRVRLAVVDALFTVTGLNLYDVVEVWQRWWREKGEAFVVPKEVPERPESDKEGRYGTFYGVPVRSQHVVFVIDQSGSMGMRGLGLGDSEGGSTEFQKAVTQTLAVLDKLPDGAYVNVILFETEVHAWKDALVKLNRAARLQIKEWLTHKSATGGTNLYDALEQGLNTTDVETVYLLSDGAPTAGKYTEDEDILEAVKKVNWKNRAVIHTVSLGFGSDLLEELAAMSGGTYVEHR